MVGGKVKKVVAIGSLLLKSEVGVSIGLEATEHETGLVKNVIIFA